MAAMVEIQRIQSGNLSTVIETLGTFITSFDARMTRLEQTLGTFVTSADARMKRLEENLDVLIRTMTTEHSNGKAH